MREKFLEEVLVSIVGKPGEKLVIYLDSKKHVNEFIISKNLELTINQVRNLLYRIADHGLVSFERKKDKKKGWYTYFWRLQPLKVFEFLMERIEKRIEHVKGQIDLRTQKQYYVCERCSIEVDDEQALQMEFMCPECGDVFAPRDNTKVLKELNKVLTKLKNQKELLEKEIEIEKGKIDKEIDKTYNKMKKEKLAKRRESARKRAATRKKNVAKKKVDKKKVAKKVKKKKTAKKKASKGRSKTSTSSAKNVKRKKVKKKVVKKRAVKRKAVKKKVVKKKPLRVRSPTQSLRIKKKAKKKVVKKLTKKVSKK